MTKLGLHTTGEARSCFFTYTDAFRENHPHPLVQLLRLS